MILTLPPPSSWSSTPSHPNLTHAMSPSRTHNGKCRHLSRMSLTRLLPLPCLLALHLLGADQAPKHNHTELRTHTLKESRLSAPVPSVPERRRYERDLCSKKSHSTRSPSSHFLLPFLPLMTAWAERRAINHHPKQRSSSLNLIINKVNLISKVLAY